ncbi:MAG: flagellar filament capping protein FliD [Magnetococcales bacterium]|nr:flagellar filament capping protein FliD [Magnetococcales bacterium]
MATSAVGSSSSGLGTVTFSGMASGLPPDLVDKLVEAQKTRLKSFQRDQQFFTDQQAAISELKTKIVALKTKSEALQDPTAWAPHTVSTSDDSLVTLTADSTAQSANHSVVVTQLASYNTAVMNTGVLSRSAAVDASGTGTFTFDYNGSINSTPDSTVSYSVNISATATIDDIAADINALDFGSTSAGVSASVLYDGSAYRLVLTAKDSGTVRGSLPVGVPPDGSPRLSNFGGSLNTAQPFTISTPTDAQLTIDGIAVISPSNQVSDALTGVTLNLKATTGVAGVNVTIANDKSALKTTLNEFVDSFNAIIDYVNLHKENTLSGDSLSRSVISQMRGVLNTKTQTTANAELSPFSTLSAMGLRTDQKTGKISFDGTSLDKALSTNFNSVTKLFTTQHTTSTDTFNEGLAHRMADLVTSLTSSSSGAITGRMDGLQARLDRLEKSISSENTRLDKVRELLTRKFSNLEQMITKMNSASGSMLSSIQKLGN